MKKRTENERGTQAENGPGAELVQLVEPMLTGMATTRDDLLAWVHAHGLAALDALFREEAAALVGPKGQHQQARTHHHWGTAATELTFGAGACRCAARGCGARRAAKRSCPRWSGSETAIR
jgi:hypothetical protein